MSVKMAYGFTVVVVLWPDSLLAHIVSADI